MRIGVISDTHGHVANTWAAARLLKSLEVEQVLHCGDIGTPAIPKLLTAWPTHFVFGNCDHETDDWRAIAAAGRLATPIADRVWPKIAIIHSDHAKLFRRRQSGRFDLVCYGTRTKRNRT
jgi:putative phosphoesterase